MKSFKRPLPLIVLVLILFVCGIALAASRTINSSAVPVAGCAEDCKEKLDKMLEKCEQIPEARRAVCRDAANAHYDKCIERCGER